MAANVIYPMGLAERVTIFTYIIWFIMFSVVVFNNKIKTS